MENYENLIKSRHSVRKYLDKEIEENKVQELNLLIQECNKKANLNMQLILNDPNVFDKFILHYGKIKNAKNYIAMIGHKDEDLDEKLGYYGEKIVLKAQELGLNTCWVAGTLNKKYITANIKDDEELVCVIAIGYGETQGNIRKVREFEDISISNDSNFDWYKKGIEFALYAPSALNQQKYRFELLDNNEVKVSSPKGHLRKVDLGIVKYHFELGAGIENFKWKD